MARHDPVREALARRGSVWWRVRAEDLDLGGRANATMKNWYGMAKVRYLGLDRNNCHLQFVAMAMNMKRARLLIAAP
jgi:IS5 family transposase